MWANFNTKTRMQKLAGRMIPMDIINNLNPLDGRKFIVSRFHEAPEHYIKVVTTYAGRQKQPVYQMTHTDRTRRMVGKEKEAIPQARFAYDFSPLSVVVKDSSKEWFDFMTSLFAIL